jgi:signal transduction histidine kinase
MNTFVLVLIIPVLLTITSSCTLYFSFKRTVDASGRYFLSAEILWLLTLLIVITININTGFATTLTFFTLSFSALLSEVAILLSLKALTNQIHTRESIYWILFVIAYCGFIEFCRKYLNPLLPLFFLAVFSLSVTLTTYSVCKKITSNGLENNVFIKWIAYTALGLTAIHVLRFASFFSGTPMMTINPSTLPIIIFSIWLSLNLFRYFAYLALRVSWADSRARNDNPLNQNLVKLSNEKDQFLQGLISSNRALGISALANSLAHQLSQPITGAILQTESVKRDLIDQGGQEKSVKVMDTVTDQLGRVSVLINNLRKSFGAQKLEFKSFDLREACDEVLEIINPTLQLKNILLKKFYVDNPIALGNPIQIQQVLINIFNNAIDAIEHANTQNRDINISIFQDQSYAAIVIKDNGRGISSNIVSSMFELYQSTKPDGLGIGLWLSKEIINKHDGDITASNHPAGGAIFQIRIPLAKTHHGAN